MVNSSDFKRLGIIAKSGKPLALVNNVGFNINMLKNWCQQDEK